MSNSRIIKFRAWDKKENKFEYNMLYVLTHASCTNGQLFLEDFVLMQFTGLHDKNGKEIYEGDIVVGEGKVNDGIKLEVVFKEGQYIGIWRGKGGWVSFREPTEKRKSLWFFSNKYYPEKTLWTVIGNIYENPELLK